MKKIETKYSPTSYFTENHVFLGEFWVESNSRAAVLKESEYQELKDWDYAVQLGEKEEKLFWRKNG